MAEQTLTAKLQSALTKTGVTVTTDELDSILNDALRMFSEEYEYHATSNLTGNTDGVDVSWDLPSDFLSLWQDDDFPCPVHPTAVQLVAGTTVLDVNSEDFYTINGKTLVFPVAPVSGYVVKLWYSGIWSTSNIPRWAERAVVYFGLYIAADEYQAMILSKSEGPKSISYKSAVTAANYREKALELIKSHKDIYAQSSPALPIRATRI